MDWQQLASLLIVAATAAAFAWSKVRSGRGPAACDSLCGCPSYSRETPPVMVFRARKGQRPQVIVKTG